MSAGLTITFELVTEVIDSSLGLLPGEFVYDAIRPIWEDGLRIVLSMLWSLLIITSSSDGSKGFNRKSKTRSDSASCI